ncbi:uncharacterized protein [Ptychodera flava]|uniref:uncharacterized protein isoform X2 n=1 Tax=Ptychodera flava TaxID=63121 RepID=UPI00396A6374
MAAAARVDTDENSTCTVRRGRDWNGRIETIKISEMTPLRVKQVFGLTNEPRELECWLEDNNTEKLRPLFLSKGRYEEKLPFPARHKNDLYSGLERGMLVTIPKEQETEHVESTEQETEDSVEPTKHEKKEISSSEGQGKNMNWVVGGAIIVGGVIIGTVGLHYLLKTR